MLISYIASHLVNSSWNPFSEQCDAKKQEVVYFTIFAIYLSSHKTLTKTINFSKIKRRQEGKKHEKNGLWDCKV